MDIIPFLKTNWMYVLMAIVALILIIWFRKQVGKVLTWIYKMAKRGILFCIKKWNWTLLWILTIIFTILTYEKANSMLILILGGVILISYGLNSIFSNSQFRLGLMSNSLMISMGILSIITAILLPKSIDIFAFVFLAILGINILFYYVSQSSGNIIKNAISVLIFTLIFYLNVGLMSGVFSYLKGTKEIVATSYILLLSLFIIIFFVAFAFVEKFMILCADLVKLIEPRIVIQHKKFLYIAISANLVIFIAGYFYLKNISTDQIRDFLVIIGIALVSSFSSVSALKNIWK